MIYVSLTGARICFMKLYQISQQPLHQPSNEQLLYRTSSGISLRSLAKETQVKACELHLDIIKPPSITLPLTQEILKYYLYYEPDKGTFVWLRPKSKKLKRGNLAGAFSRGYIHIRVHNGEYTAQRLVVLYMTGKWPDYTVDHINLNPSDNRWCNLRDVPHSINCANSPAKRKRTYGVYWDSARANWRAQGWDKGKSVFLGRFFSKELAIKAVNNYMETT